MDEAGRSGKLLTLPGNPIFHLDLKIEGEIQPPLLKYAKIQLHIIPLNDPQMHSFGRFLQGPRSLFGIRSVRKTRLHEGFWYAMDTLRDKKFLEESWAGGNAPWKVWDS